jgi:hypothetical protein
VFFHGIGWKLVGYKFSPAFNHVALLSFKTEKIYGQTLRGNARARRRHRQFGHGAKTACLHPGTDLNRIAH